MKAPLTIGSDAPDFNLPGTDDKHYKLSSLKDKKGFVIIFSCNHCPYAQAYENRIISIQKDYADKGIQVFVINSNDEIAYPEDSFTNMKKTRFGKRI